MSDEQTAFLESDPPHWAARALAVLRGHDVQLITLSKREPTLEDVFVDLVGHSMAEVERAHEPVA